MTLDPAALRLLAWQNPEFDPCTTCEQTPNHRCRTSSGALCPPHKPRVDQATGWDRRQAEVDELQRGIDQRDTVITADQDALRTAAENAATLTDQLKTARLGAALVPGLQQQIADLLAKIAELSAPPTPPPAPTPGLTLGAQFHAVWTRYGNTFGATHVDVLTKLKAAGVTRVRIDTGWPSWEPTKGKFTSGTGLHGGVVDGVLNWCRANGMDVMITIWQSPSWAAPSLRTLPTDPASANGIGKYAAEYLTKWGDTVAGLEFWNEPSLDSFDSAGPRPDFYLKCLQAFYTGAKSGAGRVVDIVFGAPDAIAIQATGKAPTKKREHFLGYTYDFVEAQAKAAGVPFDEFKPWDVQSVHLYDGANPPSTPNSDETYWLMKRLPVLFARMDAAGDTSPVWITELGHSAHENTPLSTDKTQPQPSYQKGATPTEAAAQTLADINELTKTYPRVQFVSIYTEQQGSDPAKETTYAKRHEAGFGILGPNRETTSPLYAALSAR